MKRSDLHREWARVLDMCDGTEVKPEDCWKYDSGPQLGCLPVLDSDHTKYQFAVAILEGKPVFVGDNLYWKKDGARFDWASGALYENLSWTPPKRTFMLNGIELPCLAQPPADWSLLIGSTVHYFESEDDYNKVRNALNKILDAAK